MKLDDFINEYIIKISSVWVDKNPNMKNFKNMDNWKTTLKYDGRQCTLYFSQGFGFHGKEPKLKTVLESFLADSSYVNYSVEEFTNEFGYDCYEGERIYNNIIKHDKKLQKLLGSELYDEFIKLEND